MSIWTYIILVVIAFVSFAVSTMSLLQPIISARVSLPVTKYLMDQYQNIRSNLENILKSSRMTIILWLIIDIIIAAAVILFVPKPYCYAVAAGAVLCLLFSLGRTGINKANLDDYFYLICKYVPEEYHESIGNTLDTMNIVFR